MHRHLVAAVILPAALALSACGGGPHHSRGAGPAGMPGGMMHETDACGASRYSSLIGTLHTNHQFNAPNRPVRIIGPDMAMTMDYSPNRLNVDIDGAGRITRIWCG